MTKNRLDSANEGCFTRDAREIINNNLTDVSISTAVLTANANTTLADITGLTTGTLTPGTYRYAVSLATTAGASGGLKVAFKLNNGLTFTSLEATGKAFAAAAVAVQHTTTVTDQTSLISSTSAAIKAEIDGTFVVLTSGTIQLQAAQNASNGTDTTVLVGSRFEVTRVGN